jgi:hypothetical protein
MYLFWISYQTHEHCIHYGKLLFAHIITSFFKEFDNTMQQDKSYTSPF